MNNEDKDLIVLINDFQSGIMAKYNDTGIKEIKVTEKLFFNIWHQLLSIGNSYCCKKDYKDVLELEFFGAHGRFRIVRDNPNKKLYAFEHENGSILWSTSETQFSKLFKRVPEWDKEQK